MRLSSMADYAVVTMTAAARHCGGARINAVQLADETGLPAPTVQKLVSRLAAAGLLKSVRGAGGGFKLARPAAAITLADIVEAVEGPIALATCSRRPGREDGTTARWRPACTRCARTGPMVERGAARRAGRGQAGATGRARTGPCRPQCPPRWRASA